MYRSISSIVVLGNGLLGSEISNQTNWDLISREKDRFDINDEYNFSKLLEYDVIVNCIANTNTYSTDKTAH